MELTLASSVRAPSTRASWLSGFISQAGWHYSLWWTSAHLWQISSSYKTPSELPGPLWCADAWPIMLQIPKQRGQSHQVHCWAADVPKQLKFCSSHVDAVCGSTWFGKLQESKTVTSEAGCPLSQLPFTGSEVSLCCSSLLTLIKSCSSLSF